MFTKAKIVSLAKGAAIAAAGAVLTYVSQWATGQDFGGLAPIVSAVLAVASNAVRLAAKAE